MRLCLDPLLQRPEHMSPRPRGNRSPSPIGECPDALSCRPRHTCLRSSHIQFPSATVVCQVVHHRTCALVEGAAILLSPPKKRKMTTFGRLPAGVLVPFAPVWPSQHENGEVSSYGCSFASTSIPRTSVTPRLLEGLKVPTFGRTLARAFGPRASIFCSPYEYVTAPALCS